MGEEEGEVKQIQNTAVPETANNGGNNEGESASAAGKPSKSAKQAASVKSKQQSNSTSKSKQADDGGRRVDLEAIEEIKKGELLAPSGAASGPQPQPPNATSTTPAALQPPSTPAIAINTPAQNTDEARPRTKRNTVGWKSGRLWNIYPEGDSYGMRMLPQH